MLQKKETVFNLEKEPLDYILSVHFNNLFYAFGEKETREYMNKSAQNVNSDYVYFQRHVQNLYITYGEKTVTKCWNTLFNFETETTKKAVGAN